MDTKSLYSLLLFLSLAIIGESLNCYQCDSAKDPDCKEFFDHAHKDELLIKPTECKVDAAAYCLKTTGVWGGVVGTTRFCSSRGMGNQCQYVTYPDHDRTYRASAWHIGCVNVSEFADGTNVSNASQLIECFQDCTQKNFTYVLVGSDNRCSCRRWNGSSDVKTCSERCPLQVGLSLPCGGTAALYTVRLPRLSRINIAPSSGDKAFAILVGFEREIEDGLPDDSASGWRIIQLSWQWRSCGQVAGNGSRIVATPQTAITFDAPSCGQLSVDLLARTELSELRSKANFSFKTHYLSIVDLDLANKTATSCSPVENVATALVGESLILEADADTGRNLNWIWRINGKEIRSTNCSRCLTDRLAFSPPRIGEYNVRVEVRSGELLVHSALSLMALERQVVNVSLTAPSSVHSVNSTVHLAFDIYTASIEGASLVIDSGDGSSIKLTSSDLRHSQSNYTRTCHLRKTIELRYSTAGKYRPRLLFYSPFVADVNITVDRDLIIESKLPPVRIDGENYIALGRASIFQARISNGYKDLSRVKFEWKILTLDNEIIYSFTSNSNPKLSWTPNWARVVLIKCIASNGVSRQLAEISVKIEEPVANPKLLLSPTRYALVDSYITVTASVTTGTDLTFEWDFGNGKTLIDSSVFGKISRRRLSYSEASHYKISVKISNKVSRATVSSIVEIQDSVAGLTVHPSHFVVASGFNGFSLLVKILEGTSPMVKAATNGWIFHESRKITNGTAKISHIFLKSGTHSVEVTVFNHVSTKTQVLYVEVEDTIPDDIQVAVVNALTSGYFNIFAAIFNGQLNEDCPRASKANLLWRNDAKYEWTYNNKTTTSKSPLFQPVILPDRSTANVSLQASNKVSKVVSSTGCPIHPVLDTPCLAHKAFEVVGKPVSFRLLIIPKSNILVSYGDGEKQELMFSTDIQFQHSYKKPGIYQVTAEFKGSKIKMVQSLVHIQEPIGKADLKGPSALSINSSETVNFTYVVLAEFATDLLYKWTIGTVSFPWTSRNKMTAVFQTKGPHAITVIVKNDVSQRVLERIVQVQYPINSVRLRVEPVVLGQMSLFTLIIKGTNNFTLNMNFGDDTKLKKDSFSLNSTRGLGLGEDSSFTYFVRHQYKNVGTFGVRAFVSNLVDRTWISTTATVEEAIGNISLQAVPSDLYIDRELGIQVTATVGSGKDLAFEWDMNDLTGADDIFGNATSSTVRKVYQLTGAYEIKVCVTSRLQLKGVCRSLPYKVVMMDPIKNVEAYVSIHFLEGNDTVIGIPFRDSIDPSVSGVSDPVQFQVIMQSGTDVRILVNFGDNQSLSDDINGNIHTAGVYSVSINASNQLGSAMLKGTIKVQREPEQLTVDVNSKTVLLGNATWIRASVARGSNVSYTIDWQDGKVDEGSVSSHVYETTGIYQVTVTAQNLVGIITETVVIRVQKRLIGIQLTGPNVVPIGELVRFEVETRPPSDKTLVKYYSWNVNGGATEQLTAIPLFTFIYNTPNEHLVVAKATNDFGSVTSDPFRVRVMARISTDLTIRLQNTAKIVGEKISFVAWHYFGSDVQYVWNFGDSSDNLTTTSREVWRIFNEEKKYVVSVIARNPLGEVTTSVDVFVTREHCLLPEVKVLGLTNSKVARSKELIIETRVSINCSISEVAKFSWSVCNATSGTAVDIGCISNNLLKEKDLILPPGCLNYGNYTFDLHVSLNDTIIVSRARTFRQIVPSKLISNIKGGTRRDFNRNETIIIDSSDSYDPDELNGSLTFKWSCYSLNDLAAGCFIDSKVDINSFGNEVLNLNGSLFHSNTSEFVLNVTISKYGRRSTWNSQVIRFVSSGNIDVYIKCQSCLSPQINANDRLVLVANHENIDNVVYEWNLFEVPSGKKPILVDDQSRCILADGSSYFNYEHGNQTTESSNGSNTTKAPGREDFTTATTVDYNKANEQTTISSWSEFKIPNIKERPSGRRRPEELPTDGQRPEPEPLPEEGSPPGDGAVDDHKPVIIKEHVLRKRKLQINIRNDHTTTGLRGKLLVIKENFLKPDDEYLVEVSISERSTGRKGSALFYLKVNDSPMLGICKLDKDSGVEMETWFILHCTGWKDEDYPLHYGLSYTSSENNEVTVPVYQGLDQSIAFQLPAGLNRLHPSIMDDNGAKTYICQISINVSKSEKKIEAIATDNHLVSLVSKGDRLAVRSYAQLVATALNRRQTDATDTRHQLVSTLDKLPCRTQFELKQTATALAETTTNGLREESAALTLRVLERTTTELYRLAAGSNKLEDGIIAESLVAASNVLSSTNKTVVIEEATKLLEGALLNADVMLRTPGEAAVGRQTASLSTLAGRYAVLPNVVRATDHSAFFLPPTSTFSFGRSSCLQAHLVYYESNPYSRLLDGSVSSLTLFQCDENSESATPREVTVKNLKKEIVVELPTTSKDQKLPARSGPFTLDRRKLNIHRVPAFEHRVLRVRLELEGLKDGEIGFDIKLVASRNTSNHAQATQVVSKDSGVPDEQSAYFIAVVEASLNSKTPHVDQVNTRTYHLRTWWASCVWRTPEFTWSSQGCRVLSSSTPEKTLCGCNHLTSFATPLNFAPNTVKQFDLEDLFDLKTNPLPLGFLLSVLTLYSICLFICISLDRRSSQKAQDEAIELADNGSGDESMYILCVETGARPSAGTSATVSVCLHGDRGCTETRRLATGQDENEESIFKRNSRNFFVLTSTQHIGTLYKVHIWHDNDGRNPSWFLSRVVVFDATEERTYCFPCERWLAAHKQDGHVEVHLNAMEKAPGFWRVIKWKIEGYSTDYHLWLSLCAKSPTQRFTRAQRLSVCLALFSTYMALSAAFYKPIPPELRAHTGLIDLSYRSLIVGVLTPFVAAPVNLLLILLFRRTVVKMEIKKEYQESGNGEDGVKNDDEETIAAANSLPSIFDETLISWQKLQQWAEKQWLKMNGDSEDEPIVAPTDTLHVETRFVRCWLPRCTLYIAWFLCLTVIGLSCATVVLFTMQFGKSKAIQWLQSVVFSLISCVFVLHPLLILLLALRIAYKYGNSLKAYESIDDKDLFSKIVRRSKSPKKVTFDLDQAYDDRKKSRQLRYIRPPKEDKLAKSRKKLVKESATIRFVKKCANVSLILILTCLIAFGKDKTAIYNLNRTLSSQFDPSVLNKISTTWWHHARNSMQNAFDTQAVWHLIGRPVLTQWHNRPIDEGCNLPFDYRNLCNAKVRKNLSTPLNDRKFNDDYPIWFRNRYYGKSDYGQRLGKNLTESIEKLDRLQKEKWIDDRTSAVALQFTLIHAPTSLFSTVKLITERPPTGKASCFVQISTTYLYKYISYWDNFVLACELILILVIVYKIKDEIVLLSTSGKNYIKNLSNCLN
ncbi:DgyrCDS535, partial [Dimorphilus gyrociliatus]